MKAAMPGIAANVSLRSRLTEDILSGRLSHAYIIEGAAGTGKRLLAVTVAEALGCMNKSVDGLPLPCRKCENCRKIAEGLSPDVIYIKRDPDKATVGVESARFIRSDVSIIPNELDYKIYVIEEADKMTVQAQNALLLTLEEPPAYAVFLLLCERADALLETVRSRAPIIRTEQIMPDEMTDFLVNSAPDEYRTEAARLYKSSPAEFAEMITASAGGIGKAYELLDISKRSAVLEERQTVRNFVSSAVSKRPFSEIYDATNSFSARRDELAEQLDEVCLAIRDLILLKRDENAPLCFYSDREAALDLSGERSVSYLLKLYSSVEDASESLRKNANIKLTLLTLVSGVRQL